MHNNILKADFTLAEGPDTKLLLSSKCFLCAVLSWEFFGEFFQEFCLFPAYAK